jgi:tetratricopeptide (TPR) repeat protein
LDLARHARDLGCSVFWITASSRDRVAAGLREVAGRLGDPVPARPSGTGDDEVSTADLVWSRLDATEHPWLLILDNVDEPAVLADPGRSPGDGTGWLRSSPAGLTVVTTRTSSPEVWGREADLHHVEVLDAADGGGVLLDLAAGAGAEADARALATRLGGLPLALNLAGNFLARAARGIGLLSGTGRGAVRTFTGYLDALQADGPGLLDAGGPRGVAGSETLYRRLVSRTWELSLDMLDEQGLPRARLLMRLLSCFAEAPFPVRLLESWLDGQAAEDTGAALDALIDLSLVNVMDVGEYPCLSAHRLVLEANASRLTEEPPATRDAVWEAVARIVMAGASPAPEQPVNWAWWRLFAPHAATALATAPSDPDVLIPILETGMKAFAFHWFSGAPSATGDLLESLDHRGGDLAPDHPLQHAIRHRVAFYMRDSEDVQCDLIEAAHSALAEAFGPEHPEALLARYHLAKERYEVGRFSNEEYEAEIRDLLEVQRRVLGPDNPYTTLTLTALIEAISGTADSPERTLEEFHALLSQTGDIRSGGASSPSMELLHRRAHQHEAVGHLEDAESDYRSALAKLEAVGAQWPLVYRDLTVSLANLLAHQGRPEAIECYDTALAWFDDNGHDRMSHSALRIRHARADALRELGRLAEAEAEVRAVLELRLRTADPDDEAVLAERHCLAHLLQGQHRCAEAADEFRDVITIAMAKWGPRHEHVRHSQSCLAGSLMTHSVWDEAETLYQEILAGEIEEFGPDHPEALKTRALLIRCDYFLRRTTLLEAQKAITALADSIADHLGNSDPRVISVRHMAKLPKKRKPPADASTLSHRHAPQ